jgi:hypothetical protein
MTLANSVINQKSSKTKITPPLKRRETTLLLNVVDEINLDYHSRTQRKAEGQIHEQDDIAAPPINRKHRACLSRLYFGEQKRDLKTNVS